MILEAACVGEIVQALADRGAEGRASRTFYNSAYIRVRDEVVLLLRGSLRSPMTVNIGGDGDLRQFVAVGDRVAIGPGSLSSKGLCVGLSPAPVHRSGLKGSETVRPMSETEIVRAATALGLLYSVSKTGLSIFEGNALEDFGRKVLLPLAHGDPGGVYAAANFGSLLGTGRGFTPAGDDFVAGFAASFNFAAQAIGADKVHLPLDGLARRTVIESASIIDYAQRGYVDEVLESLILAGFNGQPRTFRNRIFDLAGRGHTSGLDMSLGVLLAVASVGDYEKGGRALESSLHALKGSHALNALIRLP